MFVHAALVLLIVLTFRVAVPLGAADEPDRTTGIVLKHVGPTGEYYEGEHQEIHRAAESARANQQVTAEGIRSALPGPNETPSDPIAALPKRDAGLGPASGTGAGLGGGRLALGGKLQGNRNVEGGKARTGVFGVTGEGFKFVYVFDCSASMGSPEGRPLAAAKRELLASLESLGKLHEFQIIFYNDRPQAFQLSGDSGRLVFATEPNKVLARQFVSSIEAQLSTRHESALTLALRMRPDVIFFLTDGEDPSLDSEQLSRIERINGARSAINVIQFGTSRPSSGNWLAELARQNGGQFTFFDVRRLGPQP